jgi:hypothetical protein
LRENETIFRQAIGARQWRITAFLKTVHLEKNRASKNSFDEFR